MNFRAFIGLLPLLGACGGDKDAADSADTATGTTPATTDTGPAATDTPTTSTTTGPTTTTGPAPLAIVGSYVDSWGTEHEITEAAWTQTYPGYGSDVFHVQAYDNAAAWVASQNDAANAFNPDLFSRFDWHDDGADLWYCQAVYDAATLDDALAAPRADATDLAGGCGGFGWTNLTP